MVTGTCRLCGSTTQLCDSHLLPKALYKYARMERDGTLSKRQPITMGDGIALRSARQLKTYLLCSDCETRFSSGGEQWVIAHCLKATGEFPLRDLLVKAAPNGAQRLKTGYSVRAADCESIDIDKLAYFAVSVLWRASVHHWGIRDKRLSSLGEKFEPLAREYLLGHIGLPEEFAVLVKVALTGSDYVNAMYTPSLATKTRGYHHHSFVIPGIQFDVLVGTNIQAADRAQGCIVRGDGHPVLLMTDISGIVRAQVNASVKSKPSRGLLDEFGIARRQGVKPAP